MVDRRKVWKFLANFVLAPKLSALIIRFFRCFGGFRPYDAAPSKKFAEIETPEWELFTSALVNCKRYAEWGAGSSTEYAAKMAIPEGISVETDPEWTKNVRANVGNCIEVVQIDFGPISHHGYPVLQPTNDALNWYLEAPFSRFSPDVVLIDGRYRIACFFSSLLRLQPGAQIIFDDYTQRPHYHVIEEILAPNHANQRQALWIVPPKINRAETERLLAEYRRVMD